MGSIGQAEIEAGLRAMGLGEGDIVLLHSSLSSLGRVEGGAEAVVDAFLAVLGPSGTLAVPTFGDLGVITTVVRGHPRAVCSIHPLASVAAIGAAAEDLCREHWKAELAHGEGTPYLRIAERGGWVCLLGVDQDRNTTLHTVEELLRLPYLKTSRERTFETPEGEVTRSWPFFPGPHRDFIGLDRRLRESGKMRVGRIGGSVVRVIRSRDLIEVCLAAGREDPAFALCGNPRCADCVAQRAALRRHRLAGESFTLVASAALAGRYAEEIAERCRDAGVAQVELDALRGRPVQALPAAEVAKAVTRLREDGCGVASLRCSAVPPPALVALADELSIPRLVMPLAPGAEALAAAAGGAVVRFSLYNVATGGEAASSVLLGLKERGVDVGFTFHAANFARAGEKPFLVSYKRKLRRFVDGLVLEDADFGGTPRALAQGNAEIKEMISILRCAGFGGPMVLGEGNRFTGDLAAVVKRFEELLDAM